jgi:gamma-glutamyltranspeptidase / glutathione hydrolase
LGGSFSLRLDLVLDDHGTSHLASVDKYGGAVSLTTTVNLYWGSEIMTADGIILNDEMDDFSSPGQVNSFGFAASPANYIRPGKRKAHPSWPPSSSTN